MRPNKRFRKQSWGWWFETPSRSFWRHILRFLVIFRNPLLGELWSKLSGQIWKVPILIGFLFCTLIIRFSSSIEVCVLRNCIVPIPCCNDTVCCYCPTTFTQSGQIQVAPNSHMTISIVFLRNVWILIFTDVCSWGFSNEQDVDIGSRNGLVPNRGQAIISLFQPMMIV